MNRPILVTGGSGTLGGGVVARLLAAGHQVRVLSRRPRPAGGPAAAEWAAGDLVGGDHLAGAVSGVAAIVHCASDPRRPGVDVDGTRNLLRAAQAAGTPHLVDISIVGIDRVPSRYYQAKLEAERLIQTSGLGWTILRATQFHQLVLLVAVFDDVISVLGQTPRIVSVHSYRATRQVLNTIERHRPKGVVLHWWLGDEVETQAALDLGAYFSVNSAQATKWGALGLVPKTRLLFETDHPFGDRVERDPAGRDPADGPCLAPPLRDRVHVAVVGRVRV
jgi:NAD(P)-dependent dehydrogenase (short-subunit alcohol dehydrogenase family)